MTKEHRVPAAVPLAWPNQHPSHLVADDQGPIRATTPTQKARRSTLQMVGVRESLSDRDWQVLRTVARHRYLTTRQIEGFCFFDHATPLAGARVCRRVLRRLAELRILDHLERRVGGVRAGSASYVWQLGPVGDRLLRGGPNSTRTRQHEPGRMFLDHCLQIADVHLALVRAHRAGQLELVSVQTEPDCWRRYSGLGGARLMLQPDLYVETGDPNDSAFINCYFVEVDRGTENPARLLGKCARYEAYRHTGAEQAETGSFPLVAWLMADHPQAERLMRAIQQDSKLDDQLYRVTTPVQFVDMIRGGTA